MDRESHIESKATEDLQHWLTLGYGQPVQISKVGSHASKSEMLPILAADGPENVRATWFGYNYYSYFLGVELRREIPATMLYPISAIFGDYALSGHVNTRVAPKLSNFLKAYHNCQPIKVFGGDCGGSGLTAALVIRYLEEISKLDIEGILDVCLRKTKYGAVELIDVNSVDSTKLANLLNLEYAKFAYYDFDVQNVPKNIFGRVNVDWLDRLPGGESSVHVTMKDGVFLPPMPLPAEIFVDLRDTALSPYIPQTTQKRTDEDPYGDRLISKIPVKILSYQKNRSKKDRWILYENEKRLAGCIYLCVNLGTRDFTFSVPNVLDCGLTAFFFTKVLAPILEEIQK